MICWLRVVAAGRPKSLPHLWSVLSELLPARYVKIERLKNHLAKTAATLPKKSSRVIAAVGKDAVKARNKTYTETLQDRRFDGLMKANRLAP